MKTDKFIKVILTIIAINLTIITLQSIDLIPSANADNDLKSTNLHEDIRYGLVPVNEDGTINARISTSEVISVRIEEVDSWAFNYCTVPVEIDEQPLQVEITDQPIEVEIED